MKFDVYATGNELNTSWCYMGSGSASAAIAMARKLHEAGYKVEIASPEDTVVREPD